MPTMPTAPAQEPVISGHLKDGTVSLDRINANLALPRSPNWQFCFSGDWRALTFNLVMDRPPCWFHRLMQRWILGIHWRPFRW